MAKVICVLYDDPVTGYPKTYARDDVAQPEHYPDGQTRVYFATQLSARG